MTTREAANRKAHLPPADLGLKPLAASVRTVLAGAFLAGGAAHAGSLPVPAGVFVSSGSADQSVAGNLMTINQHSDRAILNWKSFDIGAGNTVQFKQPSASSIALNRIYQNDPSRIFGRLSANGQVYLLNQNGFLFGKGSQVDVNTLLVSTLNITDDTFQRGITKVLDQDGRAALVGDGKVYRVDDQGQFVLDEKGNRVKIGIEFAEGSSVKTANSGRIIAAAPSVVNKGDLSSPDGQILLIAATDKVYLQEAGKDSTLRGLLVEVGTGGEVANIGRALAERGNVTLMGFAVNQQGRVSATTSVRVNGSVRLLAREGASVRREGDAWLLQANRTKRSAPLDDGLGTRATVTLKGGSKTSANPDLNDPATAVDGQAQDASWVEIMGHQVRIENGAQLVSRSGKVTVTATENPANPGLDNVKNDARVYVDKGATIDVSGIKDVSVPMERNVVTVELRSNELRDSPLQRHGVLYGKKIRVDIRKGTPIADISGELERIARTVAERSTAGGTIKLTSEGDAILQRGALLDFSGGSVAYRSGYIDTTQLLTPDGKTVDIGSADPNQTYAGIFGQVTQKFKAWNVTKTWDIIGPRNLGRYEQGYVEGKAAGTLDIKAAALALEAEMRGAATAGLHQREAGTQPAGGTLKIDLARSPDSTQSVIFGSAPGSLGIGKDQPFPQDPEKPGQPAALVLSGNKLRDSGIMYADIKTNGKVAIRSGENLAMTDGGSLALTGGEIKVDGTITAHAGEVDLSTRLTSATQGKLSGAIDLGAGATIDVSGQWINDRPADATGHRGQDRSRVLVNGGTVSAKAEGDVNLAAGSRIDVSGGARRTGKDSIKAGDAGSISLEAAAVDGSDLKLKGTLEGYAFAGGKGGSLSLVSDQVILGNATDIGTAKGADPLVLTPDFFGQGGFAHYSVGSNKSGVTVSDGTRIQLSVQNRVIDPTAVRRVSGSNFRDFAQVELLPELSRQAGELDLVLAQKVGQGGKDAAVRIGDGAVIHTDAGGKISLQSDSSIFMNGTLEAAGGDVAMTVTPPAGTDPGFKADQGIWIGSGAKVDVSGTALLYSDRPDHVTGKVLDGGTITLHADRGFVVADEGSELSVSGTQGRLDVPVRGPNGAISQERRQIASSGGSIAIRAAEGIQLYGKLDGRAGDGTGAAGGGLSLELNPNTRAEPDEIGQGQTPFPKVPSVISLNQSGPAGTATVQGEAVASNRYGQAVLSAGQVERGGFGELTLRTPGRIELGSGLNLHTERSIVLDAPVLAFAPATGATAGKVSLDSAYVALGSTQTRPGNAAPTTGNGSLQVNAGLIDLVGTTALQGFDGANLKSAGDLRLIGVRTTQQQRDFLGEFLAAGDLTLIADQIYPSTLSDFRIAVRGTSDGTLTVKPGDSKGGTVLSAGGKLTLEAPNIVQGGTVKAPLGQLNFQASNRLELAAGSVTSNSAKGAIIPFGRTQGGLDWIYPLGDQNLVFTAPPEKKLVLDGPKVDIANGSVIDTRGGGDLFAFEFVPGPGGSYDLLDPTSQGYQAAYAVLPSFKGTTAPYDPLESATSGLKVGDSVYLSGGGGLKAGYYVLLPAHYALLPGAYLVTPDKNVTNIVPGLNLQRADGAPIVAGYRTVSGTGIRDALWSGFAVEPGSAARTRAEYSTYGANAFFSAKAAKDETALPYLPRDAGSLFISAETALGLDGRVSAKAGAKGRGGRLDIDATNIAIVSQGNAGQTSGSAIRLVAEKLNGLGVSSIAIGGVRNTVDGTVTVDTHASTISLEQNARLKGSEFILTAKDNITLAKGSGITAEGPSKSVGTPKVYKVDGDAAFLRVSTSDQADLQRSSVSGQSGSIRIGTGATLATSNSMIVDATANMDLSGRLLAQGGSVSLGASRIGLGADASFQNGLALNQAALNALQANELRLNSGSDISLYGPVELTSQRIVLRSGGLLGFDNAGQTASIKAGDIRLENPLAASTSRTGTGTGTLSLVADTVELGGGAYALEGYSKVTVEAGKAIVGSGTGTLTASADLDFKTPVVTGDRGADTRIDATGHAVAIQSSGAAQAAADALGAQLSITADSIRNAGTIALKSGVVKLDALKGDVVLAAGSNIDVSGREVSIGKANVKTDGGAVELSSRTGSVALESGAQLALNGSKGGELQVSAAAGGFRFDGSIDARGTERGGRFGLDVHTLENGGDVGGMAGKLASAGFSDGISLRARTGDLHLNTGDTLAARTIELAADQGSVRIDGNLKAQGDNASLDLKAGGGLTLAAGADLEAHGSTSQGGRIALESMDPGPQGGITVAAGARIDVSATDGSANGTVNLRALRTGQDVAVSGNLGSSVTGARETTVEAVRIYDHSGTIGSTDIAAWKTDTDAYMANAGAIESRLGLPGGLRAGLEIRSSGDLTLGSAGWDLVDWRYGGRPGVLTLKAAGQLSIDGKLSDGFRDDPNGIDVSGILGPGATVAVKDMLQTGSSWSYRLQAGTDVVVGADVAVRTGTGDIDVDAGRDVVLTNAGSSIYTAGRPTDTQRYGNFKNGFVAFQFYGEYPVDGGDIHISAGRDVIGAKTGQFFDGWLVRTGNWTDGTSHQGETPTAWAVAIGGPVGTSAQQGSFQQNIGALGGGNITVEAGRNVSDLSAVIATTGKQLGTPSKPNDPSDTGFNTNEVQISGGGNLTVRAGGDVLGGTFYTGKGMGEISARGAIKASTTGLGPVLALGDSRFSLNAGQDIELGAAINPTVINSATARNFFFTYSDRSGIALESLAGNVRLQNDIPGMVSAVNNLRSTRNQLSFPGASLSALGVYPASLDVTALQGDIVLERSFTTYPAAQASFNLMAGGNIGSGSVGDNVNVTQSDADPALLPGIAHPTRSWDDASQRLQPFGAANLIHAQVPVHRGDSEAARIYANGNIASVDPLLLVLPKAVDVMAGRDLFDVSLHVQHPDYAMSTITAGRDIRFTSPRNAQGNLVNLTREIRLAGPGQLWVSAGRNIDLGASEGIYTIGNTENRTLPDNGASITVMAGLNGNQARFDKFAEKYDPTSARYRTLLRDYMRRRTGNGRLDYAGAVDAYRALPGDQQHEFLLAILFEEIRISAAQAAKTGSKSAYDRGFAAIDTLFPQSGDTHYKGNLSLFFSKIHTVDGGDINLLVPGGGVNAGLAVAFAGSKAASDLGIVAQRQGAVNALVNGNFMVNQSRVFAMDGGDITIWSSNGNIDAGRGAKSAIAVPPPRITFDERGNLQVEFPPVVSGSGIRTAASTAPVPGDVFLAAPRGVVDAGEAGIGGTNVAIAATAVLGASNIQVGGTATGVPSTNVSVPVVPAGAAAAAGAATQAAMQSTVSDSEEKSEPKVANSSGLNPLKVELLGFGECSTTDIKNGSPGCT